SWNFLISSVFKAMPALISVAPAFPVPGQSMRLVATPAAIPRKHRLSTKLANTRYFPSFVMLFLGYQKTSEVLKTSDVSGVGLFLHVLALANLAFEVLVLLGPLAGLVLGLVIELLFVGQLLHRFSSRQSGVEDRLLERFDVLVPSHDQAVMALGELVLELELLLGVLDFLEQDLNVLHQLRVMRLEGAQVALHAAANPRRHGDQRVRLPIDFPGIFFEADHDQQALYLIFLLVAVEQHVSNRRPQRPGVLGLVNLLKNSRDGFRLKLLSISGKDFISFGTGPGHGA